MSVANTMGAAMARSKSMVCVWARAAASARRRSMRAAMLRSGASFWVGTESLWTDMVRTALRKSGFLYPRGSYAQVLARMAPSSRAGRQEGARKSASDHFNSRKRVLAAVWFNHGGHGDHGERRPEKLRVLRVLRGEK